jgi:hypothetical protein
VAKTTKHATDITLLMKYQTLSDDVIKIIYDNCTVSMYFEMWNYIPKSMIRLGYLGEFYIRLTENNTTTESIISVIKVDNTTFKPILDKLLDNGFVYKNSAVYKILLSISNAVFWDDNVLDYCEQLLRKNNSKTLFTDIARNLVARGNCSVKKQAKYLLLK